MMTRIQQVQHHTWHMMFFVVIVVMTLDVVGSFMIPSDITALIRPKTLVSSSSSSSSSRITTTTTLSMGLNLYGHPGTRSPLVNWGAYELGLDITMPTDLRSNPHPFGQLPCLTDDVNDAVVFESGAILLYLNSVAATATNTATDGNNKMSKALTPAQMADILSWVTWANASLDPICFLETPEGKVYDTGLKKPNRRIDRLDAILAEHQFLVDDDIFTVADVAVASYLLYAVQFFPSVNLNRWPHVMRYMKEAASRPNYARAFGRNVQSSLLQSLSDMEGKSNNKILGMF